MMVALSWLMVGPSSTISFLTLLTVTALSVRATRLLAAVTRREMEMETILRLGLDSVWCWCCVVIIPQLSPLPTPQLPPAFHTAFPSSASVRIISCYTYYSLPYKYFSNFLLPLHVDMYSCYNKYNIINMISKSKHLNNTAPRGACCRGVSTSGRATGPTCWLSTCSPPPPGSLDIGHTFSISVCSRYYAFGQCKVTLLYASEFQQLWPCQKLFGLVKIT